MGQQNAPATSEGAELRSTSRRPRCCANWLSSFPTMKPGIARAQDWDMYWKGLPIESIPQAIAAALAQPVDLLRPKVRRFLDPALHLSARTTKAPGKT